MSEPLDLATVGMAFFEPLLHEKFSAQPWDAPGERPVVELELVRMTEHPLAGEPGRRTPFSLTFDGPEGVALWQSTYELTHPKTGVIALFLVPFGRKNDRTQLQAVVN